MKFIRRVVMIMLMAICSLVRAQSVVDPSLKVEKIVDGLSQPTGLAFIPGSDDAFILEKATGQVKLLHDGAITSTVLDLNVNSEAERGLLGIALHPNFTKNNLVYLYYTGFQGDTLTNRIERFHWDGAQLTLDRRVKTLPATPGPNHDGGKIAFGPDGKLYAVIGDLNRDERTENFERSGKLSLSSVILRLNSSGGSPADNPFFSTSNTGGKKPLNDIYAYGVRNSFGLAFDAITGSLWDTENGPEEYDEINRVFPGFNSGWQDVTGPKSRHPGDTFKFTKLGAKAKYADPLFSWKLPVAPTDLAFNHSAAFGSAYREDLFVGDDEGNRIYRFALDAERKFFVLAGDLADGVADNDTSAAELDPITFGRGFGIVTSIIPRDDGMYVLSLEQGSLYRISPSEATAGDAIPIVTPEPATALLATLAGLGLIQRRRRK